MCAPAAVFRRGCLAHNVRPCGRNRRALRALLFSIAQMGRRGKPFLRRVKAKEALQDGFPDVMSDGRGAAKKTEKKASIDIDAFFSACAVV